jgi:hypothetical protein
MSDWKVAMNEEELKAKYGQLWNTTQLQQDYTVHGFAAPRVKVTRKSDGVDGMLTFQHRPRFYFNFQAEAHDRSSGITIGGF